jgi:hypothetical protein
MRASSGEILQDEIAAWMKSPDPDQFEPLILKLHAFQRAANSAYAAYCAGFPEPASWQSIPSVPQRVFRTHDLRSFPAEQTACTFHTSGTTGDGFGRHAFRTLRLYEAAVRFGWERAGLGRGRVLALLPSPDEAPHSSLSRMAGWLAAPEVFFIRRGVACWNELAETLGALAEPIVLFGTALAFLDWFEWLGDREIPLPAGSMAVETGGYKGTLRQLPKEALYARFGERLRLPPEKIANEYGMTELSSQFYAWGLESPHTAGPWARALVIDPESDAEVSEGEAGVLRLFDLANIGSVCAVQTQDLAIRRGNSFQLIGRDPAALPRGCSRAADDLLAGHSADRD